MMHDPSADELLGAIAAWLRERSGDGGGRFARLVAANALDIVRREGALGREAERAADGRMAALLGRAGEHDTLTTALCDAIRSGALADDDSALRDHLRASALDALAIDQPRYAHELTGAPT